MVDDKKVLEFWVKSSKKMHCYNNIVKISNFVVFVIRLITEQCCRYNM